MDSAVAVQTQSLRSLLLAAMYFSMLATGLRTLPTVPHLKFLSVRSRNQRATLSSQLEELGVKCRGNRLCLQPLLYFVACHEHGMALNGFLPASWDHVDCHLWDRPARLAGGSWLSPFDHRVVSVDVEVFAMGFREVGVARH